MSGRKGKSGRKPMAISDRILRGTYRGPVPDNVAPFTPSTPASPLRDWRPTPKQRHALGESGRLFLDEHLWHYQLSPSEGFMALHAARQLDEIALWRARSRRWKDPDAAVKAGRLQLMHEREFARAMGLLKESR